MPIRIQNGREQGFVAGHKTFGGAYSQSHADKAGYRAAAS